MNMDLAVIAYQVVGWTPRCILWKDMLKEGMLDNCLIATNPKSPFSPLQKAQHKLSTG
jgi:hypothetical protein